MLVTLRSRVYRRNQMKKGFIPLKSIASGRNESNLLLCLYKIYWQSHKNSTCFYLKKITVFFHTSVFVYSIILSKTIRFHSKRNKINHCFVGVGFPSFFSTVSALSTKGRCYEKIERKWDCFPTQCYTSTDYGIIKSIDRTYVVEK